MNARVGFEPTPTGSGSVILPSEATGAEFQGVTEDDLANVLEEFSGYF
ncbi:MAG: hypothetical protein IH868_12275 [Chloroflexi bacterium]|nr:hypothetical protein [Chloroflexota bacterium]